MIGTIAGIAGAVAALWLAFTTYTDVSMAGFPDGHLTAYGRAVDGPLWVVTWLALGIAVLLVVLALSPFRARVRAAALVVALLGFVLLVLAAKVAIPWYFGTHLGLDNGIGG